MARQAKAKDTGTVLFTPEMEAELKAMLEDKGVGGTNATQAWITRMCKPILPMAVEKKIKLQWLQNRQAQIPCELGDMREVERKAKLLELRARLIAKGVREHPSTAYLYPEYQPPKPEAKPQEAPKAKGRKIKA